MHKEDYNKFFTTAEFEHFLIGKGINVDTFKKKLFKENIEYHSKEPIGTYTTRDSNGDILFLKELVENMNWDFYKFLVKNTPNYRYVDFVIEYFKGLITIANTAIILDSSLRTLIEKIKNNDSIFDITELNGRTMVKSEDVNKWLEFKKTHIEIREVSIKIIDKIEKNNLASDRFYARKIQEMYKNGLFDRFKPTLGKDTPFSSKKVLNAIFINRKYENELYKQLENELTDKTIKNFGSKKDKFNFKLKQILDNPDSKNKKKTLKEFSNFATTKLSLPSSRQQTFCDILDLIAKLDKELTLYTTEEVIIFLNDLPSQRAKEAFSFFLKHLKALMPTAYTRVDYNSKSTIKKTNPRVPYTEEQYQRFGFLVLSDSHIWYEEYMKKALEKKLYSSTWLYAIFHYICAWRSGDIIKKIPRPDLRMEPKEFLDKVKSKKLTKEEALDIVEQVNMRLSLWNLRPSKTKSNTTPNLVMEIPESLFELIGTLIGITEAHYQLSTTHNKGGLLNKDVTRRETQVEFFGEEFIEIFGEDGFNNLRAVKNYEMIISRKADEKKLGTGYMLASIARAHKFKTDKKATTTMVYLKYYKNMEDSEILLSELFERGVCSFVPYLLTKIVAGEEEILNLSHEERTQKIKEIVDMNSYDSEMVIQGFNLALDKAKLKVKEIIQEAVCKGLEPSKIAKDILLNIIYDEASSKQDNLSCMLIAQGKPCIYKKRENCIGCGHEIYLKSCLFELGNRIAQAKNEALTSKTVATRNKNILMIQKVLSPIVAEILLTLKDVYKIENMDEFKKLIG